MSDIHLKFRHPFTCMVAGPTGSGKTVLVRRILNAFDELIYFKDQKVNQLKVLWAYGQWQSLYTEPIGDKVICNYVSGLPSEEEIKEDLPHIIVIDDLMTELGDNKKFADLFTKGSHHLGVSVIFISQNMYHQGKQMRTIGLNCHYYIVMKSLRGKAQLKHFASEVFPGKTKFLLEAYDDATSGSGYSYIKVDLTQETPDKYRVTTAITPEEVKHFNVRFAPTVYIPRQ